MMKWRKNAIISRTDNLGIVLFRNNYLLVSKTLQIVNLFEMVGL